MEEDGIVFNILLLRPRYQLASSRRNSLPHTRGGHTKQFTQTVDADVDNGTLNTTLSNL